MPLAFVTAYSKTKALAESIFHLERDADYATIATAGTRHYLMECGLRRVNPVEDFFPMPENAGPEFKTMHAGLYGLITHELPLSVARAPITAVVVDFKPAGYPSEFDGRPDVGGPALAKVAALAVLYSRRSLWVLAGQGLEGSAYYAFSRAIRNADRSSWYEQSCFARLALEAVSRYESRVCELVR